MKRMNVLTDLPPWGLAILIFAIRIVDVSIGTLRTISVVQGRLALSVVLGFFEVTIWIAALSQVLIGASTQPLLILAYAGGFAGGNAVGILLERTLALGAVVVRIISTQAGSEIAEALRQVGQRVTTFHGQGRDGPVVLVYVTCRRRDLARLLEIARSVDPNIFYAVEPVERWAQGLPQPLPQATGWRAVFKKK
jgi:uncharacterized protein YebE (UPF0316 family)